MSGPISRAGFRRVRSCHKSPRPLHAPGDIVPRLHANGQAGRVLRIDRLPPLRLLADAFRDLPGLAVLEGGSDLTGEGRWS